MRKICFVASIFTDDITKTDMPKMFDTNSNYDYYLFTNQSPDVYETSWNVIQMPITINTKTNQNVINSRYPKFMIWEYFQKNNMHYDCIFTCDAYLVPNMMTDWEECANQIINSENNFKLLQSLHRDANHKGINYECFKIIKYKKDTRENMLATIKFLQGLDTMFQVNTSFTCTKFYENTVFGYDPNDMTTINFLRDFWNLYSSDENPTYRDQPLWNYLLLKNNIQPLVFPGIMCETIFYKKFDYVGHTYC